MISTYQVYFHEKLGWNLLLKIDWFLCTEDDIIVIPINERKAREIIAKGPFSKVGKLNLWQFKPNLSTHQVKEIEI